MRTSRDAQRELTSYLTRATLLLLAAAVLSVVGYRAGDAQPKLSETRPAPLTALASERTLALSEYPLPDPTLISPTVKQHVLTHVYAPPPPPTEPRAIQSVTSPDEGVLLVKKVTPR